jgi:hypothetical protein
MRAALIAVFAAITLPCISRPALAGEDEVVLAIEPAYGLLAGDQTEHAVGGSASAWFGLTETVWIAASAGELTSFPAGGGTRLVYEAGGGLVAALDVLRTIPFAEASIAVVGTRGTLVPTLRAGIGADYLLSKHVSIGGVVRYRPLSSQFASDGILSVSFRLGFRFEL